jgi:FMN phosphatase YigB (HAD superfamily)
MSDVITTAPKAVIFDAGGVFLTPPFVLHQELLGEKAPDIDELRRRFFAAYIAANGETHEREMLDGWQAYAIDLGLDVDTFSAMSRDDQTCYTDWSAGIPGANELLTQVKEAGLKTAVTSNAAGDVAQLLERGGIDVSKFDIILDSGDKGRYPDQLVSRKPAPVMLNDALEYFGLSVEEAIYTGDIWRSDGEAARAAGVPFVHIDPLELCHVSDDHDHIGHVAELLPYALGEKPRRLIAAGSSRAKAS